jgi:hypothetical protein
MAVVSALKRLPQTILVVVVAVSKVPLLEALRSHL